MSVLTVSNLSKNYGPVKSLNQVSLTVPKGSVYGILGPNGSGKTTLLGIVMDVLKASSGSYLWNEKESDANQRKKIGTLLETPNFYHYLSGERNLEIAAAIKECDKNDIPRVLKMVNLFERKHSAFNTYSLGMKQRLAIASALLGDPEILVFDEPTNGLDPAGIAEIRQLILQLYNSGKTIIMASHILDEVEKVCTHVTIIQKGDVKASGTVAEVLNTQSAIQSEEQLIEIASADLQKLQQLIIEMPGIKNCIINHSHLLIQSEASVTPQSINQYCFAKGITLSYLSIKKKSLEARFLEITGNSSDR